MCGLDWSGIGCVRVAGCCEKCNEPWGFIKCEDLVTGWPRISYSRMTLLHADNFEYRMFIVVTIRHQLSLNRPVLAFLAVSSRVFQVIFVHSVYNSALFLASCCSFLLHVVANLICIFLVSRQLALLSAIPKISSILLWSGRVYPAVLLKYLILFDVSLFYTFF
jgi:hypothetical protein